MRVLLVHNYYQRRGGEEQVFELEAELLESYGHHVIRHTVHNDQIVSLGNASLAAGTIWRRSSARDLRSLLKTAKPNIAHFHNTFPLISPAAYYAASAEGIPVVQTLHNYRLLCTKGMFFRNDGICELCLGKRVPWPAVKHSCYRESAAESTVVGTMQVVHRLLRTWNRKVDRYIALTEFSRTKFIEGALVAKKISVKPNFAVDSGLWKESVARRGAVFASRLSVEKGLQPLFRAWKQLDVKLEVVGDGPLMESLKKMALPGVRLVGARAHEDVMEALRRAEFMVLPSIWYEGFPMTIVESFSVGTPVLVSRLGSLAEIIEDGVTGLHFAAGDAEDLALKVRWAADHPEEMRQMGENARKMYEEKYTPEVNYRHLMTIYEDAIEENKRRGKKQVGRNAR